MGCLLTLDYLRGQRSSADDCVNGGMGTQWLSSTIRLRFGNLGLPGVVRSNCCGRSRRADGSENNITLLTDSPTKVKGKGSCPWRPQWLICWCSERGSVQGRCASRQSVAKPSRTSPGIKVVVNICICVYGNLVCKLTCTTSRLHTQNK